MGFRLGGPLVKDKLFFFLNFELEQRDDPASSYIASWDSVSTPLSNTNVSRVKAADLEALSQFLQQKYNYNPGRYEGYALETRSHKGLIKLIIILAKSIKQVLDLIIWNQIEMYYPQILV